jgi:acetylornithine deacetylase/succinyl-diaminopimelate desuccinylase-like protein
MEGHQMTEARKKILDAIDANRDKAIKFLHDMVAIPSITGDEGKIDAFLADYMKKIGLEQAIKLVGRSPRVYPSGCSRPTAVAAPAIPKLSAA